MPWALYDIVIGCPGLFYVKNQSEGKKMKHSRSYGSLFLTQPSLKRGRHKC